MSIGSVRTIYLVKQKNFIAFILAFIEITIWFLVAQRTLTSEETNIFVMLSYASGYATGTYVGGLINKYFVKGNLTLLVITYNDNANLIEELKNSKYGVSKVSMEEDKMMLLIEIKKKNLQKVKKLIKSVDKNAFIIVNESLNVENGYIM